MANLASLFAVPLALVAQDVKENQKSHQTLTHPEANQKESNTGLRQKLIRIVCFLKEIVSILVLISGIHLKFNFVDWGFDDSLHTLQNHTLLSTFQALAQPPCHILKLVKP